MRPEICGENGRAEKNRRGPGESRTLQGRGCHQGAGDAVRVGVIDLDRISFRMGAMDLIPAS